MEHSDATSKTYGMCPDSQKISNRDRTTGTGEIMLSAKETITNAPFGIMYCTLDEMIVEVNRKAARMLGYRSAEALPLNLKGFSSLLVHSEDYSTLRQTLKRRGVVHNATVAIKKANGNRAWVQVNARVAAATAEGGSFIVFHFHDITKQKMCEHRLQDLAITDPLTRLCNRRQFEQLVKQGLQEATHRGDKLGLLYLDIDRFKEINDTYGHRFGDKTLYAFTQRVSKTIRHTDVFARVGGDEFCILVSQIDSVEGMHTMVQGLFNAMKTPFIIDGVEISVQASIGMAVYPFHGSTLEELIEMADRDMYMSKRPYLSDTQKMLPIQRAAQIDQAQYIEPY